jgi:hypothetical protein
MKQNPDPITESVYLNYTPPNPAPLNPPRALLNSFAPPPRISVTASAVSPLE